MAIDDTPLEISEKEKQIAFDLFQRLKDIEEQYTGEAIVGAPSSLTPDSSDKQPAIKVAKVERSEMDNFNTPDLDQGADSILKPGETLEDDFDVTFRKPNAAGGIASLKI